MPQPLLARLPHPAVDWSDEIPHPTCPARKRVRVQCPECPMSRYVESRLVASRIRAGVFTGRCTPHQQPREWVTRMDRPQHPAVDWTPVIVGRHRKVAVTCPGCGAVRMVRPSPIAGKIRAGQFTGLCLPCSPNARKREWIILGPGRKLDPVKGYVRLTREAIDPDNLWLYDAMRGKRAYVLEHRMVMARALSRPLTRNELVDHRDGIKTRNDPDNLRLYRRGKNDDGSGCGYGTFYDEWQRAEAEVRRLRAQLDAAI